jgi:hypothetical protein
MKNYITQRPTRCMLPCQLLTNTFIPILAALLPLASLSAAPLSTIPVHFHGNWAGSYQACQKQRGDDTRLKITANTLEFYESKGTVQEVVTHSKQKITVVAQMSGEGQTWKTTTPLQLSPDGKRITDSSTSFVRVRCPDK